MLTVIAPWLEGGGAQRTLEALVRRLPEGRRRLVLLFAGSRDHASTTALFDEVVALDLPRSPYGAWRAARALPAVVPDDGPVYSLMRASNVVLGLAPRLPAWGDRLALSFHMLPSDDRSGPGWRVEEAALRRACRAARLVTTPSAAAAEQLRAYGLAPQVQVVPNLLLPEERPVVPARPGPRRPVRLVFLGRLEAQKGLDRLPELLAAASDVDLVLDVVGEGSQAAALASAADRLSPRHRLVLHGRQEDVVPFLDAADALLMPSRAELDPVAVQEAWRRGRPALTSDLPVLRALAERGPLAVFRDGDDLAALLRRLRDGGAAALLSARAAPPVDPPVHLLLAFLEELPCASSSCTPTAAATAATACSSSWPSSCSPRPSPAPR